jgi:hypothetical protein
MSDADRHRLTAYLRILADRMGLRDWTVDILDETATEGVYAEVSCLEGRKFARLRFDYAWADLSPEDLRQTCCHELLHCHLAPLQAELERRLKPSSYATAEMLMEYAIDGIADAWESCLPLMLSVQAEKDI